MSNTTTQQGLNLPKRDSPSLKLVHPTEGEKLLTWRANGAYWRGALSMDAYCRREEHLATQPLTRHGAMTYWVLVDGEEEPQTATIEDEKTGEAVPATNTTSSNTKEPTTSTSTTPIAIPNGNIAPNTTSTTTTTSNGNITPDENGHTNTTPNNGTNIGTINTNTQTNTKANTKAEAKTSDTTGTSTQTKARTVLSSCETLRKRALVAHDNKVEDVVAQGVGSVFCQPHLRGHGYSSRMMDELARKLTTHHGESGKCAFTVLFSDIGKKFYAKHGWHPFDSTHIALPPAAAGAGAGAANGGAANGHAKVRGLARPLYANDLAELCEADERLIRRYLTAKASVPGKVHVALVPDVDTMQWHHSREEFIAEELFKRDPAIKGAIVGDEPGKRVWCIWTRTWASKDDVEDGGNVMQILRIVAEEHVLASCNDLAVSHHHGVVDGVDGRQSTADSSHLEEAIVALLLMAQDEANKWNMKEVNIWNPTDLVVRATRRILPSAEVIDRESESITSLMWYGNGLDGVKEYPKNLVWVGNEKYGWC
ncbi:hypothetical protein L228DRAFT_241596 [Xylona heveae TC161]|uniref:LYC1 C-terminal domain-containing protein n=1 Tax=Xylona heveae (strain CBS 132557 / TC161) TaxID=1328760 RepID=A0A164ZPV1_XYLHT|nr:hypothetical protein L228DRAFT_241596 [Xylona heveae TC161]KZF19355.1 hypothetical protein L228DRAFT_241596 [Xylona heveae TC161]